MFEQMFNVMVEKLIRCANNAEFPKEVYDCLHSDLETL